MQKGPDAIFWALQLAIFDSGRSSEDSLEKEKAKRDFQAPKWVETSRSRFLNQR